MIKDLQLELEMMRNLTNSRISMSMSVVEDPVLKSKI